VYWWLISGANYDIYGKVIGLIGIPPISQIKRAEDKLYLLSLIAENNCKLYI
jgi:hypothetical protein